VGNPFVFVFAPDVLKYNLYMLPDFFSNAFLLSRDYIFPEIKISVVAKGAVIIALLFFLSLRSQNKKKALLFLFAAIIWLIPSFLVNRPSFQGNRFYISSAFLFMCVFYIVLPYLTNFKRQILFYFAVSVFLIISAVKINNRINIFYDDITFYGQAVSERGDEIALINYIDALMAHNRYEESVEMFEKLIELRVSQDIITNYAKTNMSIGKYEKAAEILEQYAYLFPQDKDYYEFVLICYLKTDKINKIEEYKQKIISYNGV
jgi:tetratricopeptide (TPR) repeat protein